MKSKPKMSFYKTLEKLFPDYLILQKEGFMYTAHGLSAEALGVIMEYTVVESNDGRAITGGPDIDKIMGYLRADDYNFIVGEKGEIVDGHSGRNPFEFLRLKSQPKGSIHVPNEKKPSTENGGNTELLDYSTIRIIGDSEQIENAKKFLVESGVIIEELDHGTAQEEKPLQKPTQPKSKSRTAKELQEELRKCDNCQLRKNGLCSAIRSVVCPDFKMIPYISPEEKASWPDVGDATWIRFHSSNRS